MRALITGATGFAGSHLVEHLISSGDEVLGCSRNGKWPRSIPQCVREAVRLFTWDLTNVLNPVERRRIAEFRPDTIYHLAAMSVPGDCGTDEPTPEAMQINVGGVRAVCELSRELDSSPRIVHVSSCYVYAPVTSDSPIVSEAALINPRNAYGKTKLLAEREVGCAVEEANLDVVVARTFQHTGPRQSPRMILPDWVRQFTRSTDEPIRVGCLNTYLDLTDVRDICRAYRRLAVDGQSGVVYNVGSGICRRSGDLYQMIENAIGSGRHFVESDPNRRQHPIADITRLTAATGWQPKIPIEQTVQDTIRYWQDL